MSRSIEDRLVAALEARAELVTPEDLGPMVVPDRRRRGVVLLLAAAAVAAVAAAPFVLDGGGGASEPGPVAPPSVGVPEPSEPEPTEAPTEPSDVVVVERQRADVDGDGRPDRVRVLLHSLSTDEPAEGSVAVSLAAGGTGVAAVPFGYAPELLPAVDVNGDGREQVLLRHTEGGDSASLLVYTWHEGALVPARIVGHAPLMLELDGRGKVVDHYVDARGLFSWRRLDPVDPGGAPIFMVEQWSWSVEGDRLVPTPAGQGCVDVTASDPPQSCEGQKAS